MKARALFAVMTLLAGCHARRHADTTSLPRLWAVPDFRYVDQLGQTIDKQQLLGHAWVADFIFTHCTSVCPVLSAQMLLLQKAVPAPDARFISFSVDPARDTPAVLAAYAERWHVDGRRWHLLATDAQTLPRMSIAMKMKVQRAGQGDGNGDDADQLIHSNRMQLVDAEGWVRGVYDSSDPAAMARLGTDLQSLVGATQPAATAATGAKPDGAALYAALACAACHDKPSLAPALGGLYGKTITLDDGRAVTVDDAYLRESLVDPNAKRASGFGPTMPSYAGRLRDDQLRALVGYVASLPAKH